jgi:hypothetical protein
MIMKLMNFNKRFSGHKSKQGDGEETTKIRRLWKRIEDEILQTSTTA